MRKKQHITFAAGTTYYGGKGSDGTYQTIINQIPPHDIFASLYAGMCSITRYKRPARMTVVNDLNDKIIDQWKRATVDSEYNFNLIQLPATHLISRLDNSGTFIYLDPPYPFSTRKDNYKRYEYEMSDDDHESLLSSILEVKKSMVAISTYPNELYNQALSGWRKIEFESTTRHGKATEWLFMNYPEPTELHDYSFLGCNYRDRENITRRHRNLMRKINELPQLERKMLFEEINQLYSIKNKIY